MTYSVIEWRYNGAKEDFVMQKQIMDAIGVCQGIIEKYELRTLGERLDSLTRNVAGFKIRILFVGAFSAGKSALINAAIGRDLLEEDQVPETAIASEIIYDTAEYIEGISGDGSDRYLVEDAENIDITKYDYLIWHLDSEYIRKMKDIVLVDMPGFNSGISNHNKAILRYAGQGNAYILVIDCEEGAIKQNILDFIHEIKNYDNNLSVALTKTDLKLDKDVEQIKASVEANASVHFGGRVSVVTTSKYDTDAGEKILSLTEKFDKEEIFSQEFAKETYDIGIKCLDSLEIYKKSLSLGEGSFDAEIRKHEKSKDELVKKLEREKGKLERRFRDNVAPSIIADVQNALYSHTDALTGSLKAGEQAFSMTVNNILRPVMANSTQNYVEQSFGRFISELDLSSISGSVHDISVNAMGKYKQANEKLQEIAQNGQKLNATYKAVTTALAVTTSVIAPWLELVLIFLPDIISLLGGRSKENALENRVNNEIIPQIVNKIKPEIEKSLVELKDEMIVQVETEIQELIDCEIEAISNAEECKKKENRQYEENMRDIDKDIEMLRHVMKGSER